MVTNPELVQDGVLRVGVQSLESPAGWVYQALFDQLVQVVIRLSDQAEKAPGRALTIGT